jgi:methylmalonyl-CoA mutase cobalamin-binding subunit
MRDIGTTSSSERNGADGYGGLALDVIERLVARRTSGVGVLQRSLLDQLLDAASSHDAGSVERVLEVFRSSRVSNDAIVGLYIPEAARKLGKDWEDDKASFAQVTMGVARLQGLMRDLTADWTADTVDPDGDKSVLVIVPPGEQHTLGATVLAWDLRRKGISACVRVAPSMLELADLLENRQFDGALISVGSTDRVETCMKLVKTLNQLSKGALRIAVGGAVKDMCRDALEATGAAIVTNDLEVVVTQFGLGRPGLARDAR